MRINLRSFKFCMIYCSRTCTFNGWLIRTRPFANIPRADRKITPRFDWRWHLSPQWKWWWEVTTSTKTSNCTETLLAPHTAAAHAVQIFTVFISNMERTFEIYKNLHHLKISCYTIHIILMPLSVSLKMYTCTLVSIALAQHQMFLGGMYACAEWQLFFLSWWWWSYSHWNITARCENVESPNNKLGKSVLSCQSVSHKNIQTGKIRHAHNSQCTFFHHSTIIVYVPENETLHSTHVYMYTQYRVVYTCTHTSIHNR